MRRLLRAAIRFAASAFFLGLGPLAASCATLDDVQSNTCGNGVVEAHEDCDDPGSTVCGAPESPAQCRFLCDGNGACAKPGYRCDHDLQICVTASGTFNAGAAIATGRVHELHVANINGDAYNDVVAVGDVDTSVFFLDRNGEVSGVSTVPQALDGLDTGRLTSDPTADIAFPSDNRVGALLGTAAGDLDPAAYPAISVPNSTIDYLVAGTAYVTEPADDVAKGVAPILVLEASMMNTGLGVPTAGVFVARSNIEGSISPVPIAVLHLGVDTIHTVKNLAGPVVFADFDESTPTCDEVVTGFRQESQLSLVSSCVAAPSGDSWAMSGAGKVTTIALPGPLDATLGGAMAYDFDRDGHMDLLVGPLSVGGKSQLYVGHGDGTGHFTFELALDVLAGNKKLDPFTLGYYLDDGSQDPTEHLPLAIGDLDIEMSGGDPLYVPLPDYVTPSAVITCSATTNACTEAFTTDRTWTVAAIAELNADGLNDVIAGAIDGSGVDFLNNAGDRFNPYVIPTTYPISRLTVGDFDGDLINDVAFVEEGSDFGAPDVPAVVFGNAFGGPTDAVELGRIADVYELLSVDLLNGDGIRDLALLSRSTDQEMHSFDNVAIFLGASNRLLISTYGLEEPQMDQKSNLVARAFRTVIGDLDGVKDDNGDTQAEIGVLATEEEIGGGPTAWMLKLDATATTIAQASAFHLSKPACMPASATPKACSAFAAARAATGTLVPGTHDDLVVVTPKDNDHADVEIVTSDQWPPPGENGKPGTPKAERATGTVDVGLVANAPDLFAVKLVDLDGDGAADLVVLGATLTVVWGDGQGDFLYKTPTVVGDSSSGFLAVAPIVATPNSSSSGLALLSANGVQIATFDASHKVTLNETNVNIGGSLIATGDLNGDGVDDLAIGSNGSVHIFLGQPVAP